MCYTFFYLYWRFFIIFSVDVSLFLLLLQSYGLCELRTIISHESTASIFRVNVTTCFFETLVVTHHSTQCRLSEYHIVILYQFLMCLVGCHNAEFKGLIYSRSLILYRKFHVFCFWSCLYSGAWCCSMLLLPPLSVLHGLCNFSRHIGL
jgi:hypothetical protein